MSGRELIVRVADLKVGSGGDILVTIGLGSCVAIALHDPEAGVGGLAHILLPSPALTRAEANPARCAQTAVPALLEQMSAQGANPRRIRARLVGGASMFGSLAAPGTIQMGERNLVASRQVLAVHGVPIVGEDVGADYGRTVRFRVQDGVVEVLSVSHGNREL